VGLTYGYRKLSLLRPNLTLSRPTSPTFRAHLDMLSAAETPSVISRIYFPMILQGI
ncbi:hypothetical protein GGP70_002371, partial [Salinibacter ruber]|nr:hypothetical protein [Salinibacter ruber]